METPTSSIQPEKQIEKSIKQTEQSSLYWYMKANFEKHLSESMEPTPYVVRPPLPHEEKPQQTK
jgi:hypothetical protein